MSFDSITSFGNKLIVESYKHEGLTSDVRSGFASVSQKNKLKGLKVLVDAKLSDGTLIPASSTAYIKEELLSTQHWAKYPLKSDNLESNFIIVSLSDVEFIVPFSEKS